MRFEKIIKLYQKHEAAKFAANLILDYLLAKQDWTKAAAYAARFKEQMVGGAMEEFAKIEERRCAAAAAVPPARKPEERRTARCEAKAQQRKPADEIIA